MIGSRLRSLRVRRGISVRDAARATGIPPLEIVLCERDEILPCHYRIERLAEYYGNSLSYVLTGRPPQQDRIPADCDFSESAGTASSARTRPGDTGLGERLFDLRVRFGLTRDELAAALRTTRRVIRAVELGDLVPDRELRRRYAAYFGLRERELERSVPQPCDPQRLPEPTPLLCDDLAEMLAYEDRMTARRASR